MNTNNNRRKHARERRSINVAEMREAARCFLDWEELTPAQAADFIDVNVRNWKRWETREKFIADSQIKLFWYEVAFAKLEALETGTDKAKEQLEKELGGVLTLSRVLDYAHTAWEKFDPAIVKHNREKQT